MTFDEFNKKYDHIMKWLPEYVDKHFNTYQDYGHLADKHVNESEQYLKNRCKREKVDASTFIGEEDQILAMINQDMRSQQGLIDLVTYLADDDFLDEYTLYFKIRRPITGIVFLKDPNKHCWLDGPIECFEFSVIIKKTDTCKNNEFYVKTVHPSKP